jgi:hypothetical protein
MDVYCLDLLVGYYYHTSIVSTKLALQLEHVLFNAQALEFKQDSKGLSVHDRQYLLVLVSM